MGKKAKQIFYNLDFIITGIALVILISCTIWGVVRRYILGAPIIWLEEIQMGCIVWIVFIGAGAVFRSGGHVAIEILVEVLPRQAQKVIHILTSLFVGGLLVYLMMMGGALTRQMAESFRMTSILRIPYTYIYGAMPVGCFLMLVNMIVQVFLTLRTSEPDSEQRDKREEGTE